MTVLEGNEWGYNLIKFVYMSFSVGLLISVFFDPSNQIFGLKTILFYCFAVVSVFVLLSSAIDKRFLLFVFVIGVFLPVTLAAVGFYRSINWDSVWAFNIVKSHFFIFSLVFFAPIASFVFRVFLLFCFFLSLAIVALFLGVSLNYPPAVGLSSWLTFGVENAKIGTRVYGDLLLPMIYYKTSVLLIIGLGALGLVRSNSRCLMVCFFSIALFLSGTRANILASFFLLMVYFFQYWVTSKQVKKFLMLIFIPAGAYALLIIMSHFLDPDEISITVKSFHLQSYLLAFREDPWALLVGQGYGSGFYSIYHEGIVYETELTLLELLRRGGIGSFLTVVAVFLYPVFQAKDYLFKASFLAYFLVSSTNPLLISSTGMLALSMGYIYLLIEKAGGSNMGGRHV